MKKTIATVAILALIGGAFFYAFLNGSTSEEVAKETQKTDAFVKSVDERTKEAATRIKSIDSRVKKNVEVIRRETKKHVDALPADRVADGINQLLNEWRAEQEQ